MVTDDADVTGKLFDVHATPTTLMIDENGRILFRNVGFAPGKEEALAAQVEYLIRAS